MEKNKSNVGLIIIIILLIFIIIGMVVYLLNKEVVMNDKEEMTTQMKNEEQGKEIVPPVEKGEHGKETEQPVNNENVYHPLFLDKKNQIYKDNKVNNTDYDYHFKGFNDILIGTVENNSVVLTISSHTFSSSHVPYKTRDINIHTSKKIQEVFYGMLGQGIAGTPMLFLLEDGTVEYIYMYEAIKSEDFTVKKVPEVNNIVKFYQVDVKDEDEGWATVLAQRNDGKFYDLRDYLPEPDTP